MLHDFRASTTRFLITTNVLSRGIDVPAVTLVIQFDMPVKKGGHYDPETYLHRVGRTGRFGRPGAIGRWVDRCQYRERSFPPGLAELSETYPQARRST